MPKARRRVKRRASDDTLELKSSTWAAVSGIVQICLSILLLLALFGNAGRAGTVINAILTFLFGRWGVVFPVFLFASGILRWIAPDRRIETKRSVGLLFCLLSFLGLMHLQAPFEEILARKDELAGAVGFMVSLPFFRFLSPAAGYTILGGMFLAGLVIAFEPDLGALFARFRHREPARTARTPRVVESLEEEYEEEPIAGDEDDDEDLVEQDAPVSELNIVRPAFAKASLRGKVDKSGKEKLIKKKTDAIEMKDTRYEEWTFPAYDLLEDAQSQLLVDDDELKAQAKRIEEKLKEFEIDVTLKDARPGPTVTQFTLEPAEGVRLSKIAGLKDDLALALAAPSLRIEAPIPGKSLVGIEMPNIHRSTVHLREIMESPSFVQSQSSLTLPLGRDVSGEAVVANLETMPHLLIAGATGSGKSVCMNTFLTSLLYQNAPHELKFILIDPKRVELMPYGGIPHLLTPVLTEAEKALQALRWAVAEMGRRLHRFSEQGARNIDEFNDKQKEEQNLLPRIVIVVDELADLMMRQFRRDTETMIARVAQMARAVGMHLIIATQRPSVDVITGLIKANIPTRIAFRVVSSVDSRTILDGIGAEDLLGQGDMLFMDAKTPKPVRMQGIFTSTQEVERVINAVKIAGGGKITEQIGLSNDDENGEGTDDGDNEGIGMQHQMIDLEADDNGGDDMFFEAVRVVQETGKASASLLQRQLKVGYARAARLLDIMEEKGLIGPPDGAKPRKVYIDKLAD
ncbi:MAG: DNA translocase FtsK 4TM domain-containing protein [Candidatus Peribacteraceae bacterium]|nr:DNA translocase FtsK 4TM domain-containing protein [Candidatus Peribacteraceae bacterium]